ncbi:hypothetical protein F751_1836 [Auxenochlorella protothecoides]|uniref:Uncharacterized protein n=1 Tax=Auxenochlorella protothecoides TaxID=3075 RepID=A0A087SGV3_AUXPR|nr:hypothetical protein F751_1836 [Auxenochlorella protothecoides]KFM24957.1 hypothetical protein F751_1836 [Auxenochlorella protothecoides]
MATGLPIQCQGTGEASGRALCHHLGVRHKRQLTWVQGAGPRVIGGVGSFAATLYETTVCREECVVQGVRSRHSSRHCKCEPGSTVGDAPSDGSKAWRGRGGIRGW